MVTDGCLSKDGRHLDFTSKDKEQIDNFLTCLNLTCKISDKVSGKGNRCLRVQFSNVLFYQFLVSVGLTPAKSKTLGEIKIPDEYFFDAILRGCFDGDGCFYSYWDPRWRSSHMFYVEFVSASIKHLEWVRNQLQSKTAVFGHLTKNKTNTFYQLKYAKKEALEIIKRMYYNPDVVCLSRKKNKVQKALNIEREQQLRYT